MRDRQALRGRYRGSMLGLAIGDALGYPTEFVSTLEGIRSRWGPDGVTGFESAGGRARGTFTDDTQMTIAVARALVRAGHRDVDALMDVLAQEFVAWSRSPSNDRAPGGTCLSGCSSLRAGVEWRRSGVAGSKGCGAAMRAAPIGLYHYEDDLALARVATAQSALTHRHPTGYASSTAAAAAVAWVARGEGLEGLIDFVSATVESSAPLLVELGCEAEAAERPGVGEMLAALERTRDALGDDDDDVCRLLGGGWIGEEAVACALWCALKARGAFRESVLRGANSSGDSDSIACIAGSITGALGGLEAIPDEWVSQVEASRRLLDLADALALAREEGRGLDLDPSLDFFGVRDSGPLLGGPRSE